jgi:hypothetical protein
VATEEQLQKVEAILVEFAKCEARMFEVMGMPADSDRITCAMLKGFIHVRMFESLQKEGYSNPIQMDVNWARAGMNCLLKVAYDLRAVTEVKLVKPVVPTLEGLEPEVLNIHNPVIAVACWRNVVLRSPAIITRDGQLATISRERTSHSRCARFSEEVTSDMKREADTLFIILKERFVHRVRSRIPIPERRVHYSLQMAADNFSIFPALSVLARQAKDDLACAKQDTCLLFTPTDSNFCTFNEVHHLQGCYMYYDSVTPCFVRSGMVIGVDRNGVSRNIEVRHLHLLLGWGDPFLVCYFVA